MPLVSNVASGRPGTTASPAPQRQAPASTSSHRGLGRTERRPRPSVLVVDDNRSVVKYIEHTLSDEFDVTTASDGSEGLATARRIRPDLVITDVMMPVMDGYELCRRLKADERLGHVPIILLTARSSTDDRVEGLELGSDDHVAKPFDTRELKARARNLIAAGRRQRVLADENRALNEESAMKTQLLNIAAHDLKNPLSAIRELAQIVKREVDPGSEALAPLDLIHESSDRMLQLVSSLLESSAMEEGRLVPRPEPVDLGDLAAAVARRNGPLAAKKAQTITLKVESEGCVTAADPDLIFEAMDNLVNNAVKYAPHDTTITMTVQAGGRGIRFAVRDEGPGLSPSDKDLLFRRFQRLSPKPTGGERSTGLGLAIVKQIVDLHSGSITVQSEPGCGSTFSFDLPIC